MTFKLMQLKEVCEIKGGFAFKSKDFVKSGIPVIRIGDIANEKVQISEKTAFVPPNFIDKCASFIINKDDILIALSGATTGKYGIYDLEFTCLLNQRVAKIVPKDKFILPKYLYYYLEVLTIKILDMAAGAAQPNISPSKIGDIEIPVPDIKTQIKIVEILDKTQELINKRQEQIEKLDGFLQSEFLDMFGNLEGEKKVLSEISIINPPKAEIRNLDENTEVTFIPMANVSDKGKIDISEKRRISEVYKGFTYFKNEDVLFAKITPCMENGKGAIARNLLNGIGFGSTEFHVLRPKENVTSEWLYFLTSQSKFRKLAEKFMTGSAGQKRVPKQFFDQFKVILPPIELQNKFAQIVNQVEKQKEQMQKSLTEMENLFNSIMQKAFKGELFIN